MDIIILNLLWLRNPTSYTPLGFFWNEFFNFNFRVWVGFRCTGLPGIEILHPRTLFCGPAVSHLVPAFTTGVSKLLDRKAI